MLGSLSTECVHETCVLIDIILQVSLDDSKIECQRVTTKLKQRDIDLNVSETSKVRIE
jgi:hypothetical protein